MTVRRVPISVVGGEQDMLPAGDILVDSADRALNLTLRSFRLVIEGSTPGVGSICTVATNSGHGLNTDGNSVIGDGYLIPGSGTPSAEIEKGDTTAVGDITFSKSPDGSELQVTIDPTNFGSVLYVVGVSLMVNSTGTPSLQAYYRPNSIQFTNENGAPFDLTSIPATKRLEVLITVATRI